MKKRILSAFLAVCLIMAAFPVSLVAAGEYTNTTVILFTGNIRGDIDILPRIAAVRADFEARGADVILVDSGNFLHGTIYSSFNSGSTMMTLMVAAGYDVVGLGTYDFAFGTGTIGTAFHGDAIDFGPLGALLYANPEIRAVSENIIGVNDYFHSFTPYAWVTTPNDISFKFFGVTDPATPLYILETSLAGLEFADGNTLVDSTLVFLLSQDTAPAPGTVDVVIFNNSTAEFYDRTIELNDIAPCPALAATVADFRAAVHAEFTWVGHSEVTLDGLISTNRGGESSLGNFWTDALRWFAVSGEIEAFFGEDDIAAGNNIIHVESENVVALWNAGNLRDFLYAGDVTIQDLRRVLPFPNTVAVVYLTGAELLEQLEASAQGLPFSDETFPLTASFMHVSGIEYTIDTAAVFNAGEAYRDRIWHRAQSVERVTITSINGRPFDENAIYAVITSNANFNGMDISYVLAARESDAENLSTITTARVVDHAVVGFINSLPNATITAEHAHLQGRINLQNGGELVPLRATAEGLGAVVEWIPETSTAVITTALGHVLTVYTPDHTVTHGRTFVTAAFITQNLTGR